MPEKVEKNIQSGQGILQLRLVLHVLVIRFADTKPFACGVIHFDTTMSVVGYRWMHLAKGIFWGFCLNRAGKLLVVIFVGCYLQDICFN